MQVVFDEPTLVADAGLIVPATLMVRLGLEGLVNDTVRLVGRVGGAMPGRKVLTLVAAILAGGTHIDHADRLRAGATQKVLPFKVMAPSTLGTFLRAFTFGHIRQLDRVHRRRRSAGRGRSARVRATAPMTIDLDSTICEVHGKAKHGAAYGYTRVLGYHPMLATRADTGEVLHARLRKGSSQRGVKRFAEELVARVRRAGATGPLTVRADAGFWSYKLIDTLTRLGVSLVDHGAHQPQHPQRPSTRSTTTAWITIAYPDGGTAQVAETTYVTGKASADAVAPRGAPHPAHRHPPAPAVARLAPPRLHHRPRPADRRHRPVPPRPRHRRARHPRPQRRRRPRALPLRPVLRQRRLARPAPSSPTT